MLHLWYVYAQLFLSFQAAVGIHPIPLVGFGTHELNGSGALHIRVGWAHCQRWNEGIRYILATTAGRFDSYTKENPFLKTSLRAWSWFSDSKARFSPGVFCSSSETSWLFKYIQMPSVLRFQLWHQDVCSPHGIRMDCYTAVRAALEVLQCSLPSQRFPGSLAGCFLNGVGWYRYQCFLP